jgi:death-on-curing protein
MAGFGDLELYVDLSSKAAVLTYSIIKSHPCADGNKRTALLLLVGFLGLNDAALEVDDEELSDKMRGLAASHASDKESVIADFAGWLETAIQA